MAEFSSEIWALIGVVAAVCMLGCLHVLAAYYREHTRLHDLRTRVAQLRREYAQRIANLNAVIDVDEDSPRGAVTPAEPASKAA